MIDLQSTNVQNLSEIKSSMHEALRLCDETNHFFSNGFRAEIKNHVSMEVRLLQSQMQDLSRNSESISRSIDEINMFLKRPTTWLKIAVMLIVSIATATGAIGGCYYAIHQQFSSHTKTNETISVQETKSTNTN